jgi:hypothetical protein
MKTTNSGGDTGNLVRKAWILSEDGIQIGKCLCDGPCQYSSVRIEDTMPWKQGKECDQDSQGLKERHK